MWYCIEGLFREVAFLEVGVHVEALGTEVERPGHVGDDALPALPYLWGAHPHVPVPLLQGTFRARQV